MQRQKINVLGNLVGEQQLIMLNAKIAQLSTTPTAPMTIKVAKSSLAPPLITSPDTYSVNPAQCKMFALQCSLYFSRMNV